MSDHVLDAGCGFGYGADMLSQFSKNVVGIDKNPTAISVAKNKYRSKVKYFVYDIEEISPHNFQFFDYVTMFEVIEHLTNPKKALERIHSIIKDGGKLFISTPNKRNSPKNNQHHINEFSKEDLEEILIETGFTVTEKFGQYPILGDMAEIAKKATGYKSNTNKCNENIPNFIDNIPLLANIFSGLYKNFTLGARGLYLIAKLKQ